MNAREIALEILHKTIKDESYSNLLMRKKLNELDKIQRPFATNLVNGVLRNYETLNYQLEDIKNVSLRNRLILCMALFERFYLSEKDYAVNNEYVGLAKNQYDRNFINAILRKASQFKQPDKENIKANLPEWIYDLLKAQYGDDIERIISVFSKVPETYYHLNRKKCSYEDLKDLEIRKIDDYMFTSSFNLLNTSLYRNGYFYVQDYNSSCLWQHLSLEKGNSLLDVCSAPGSKLFNCLDVIDPSDAFSNDIHEHRVKLIEKMADKLGYEGIHYSVCDGLELYKNFDMKFDRIMLDVPCSGLGVIGRKPDLKFHITSESLDELQKLQADLLENNSRLLKVDGIMLYSTCTLNKKENERQILAFLKKHDEYVLMEEDTIINDMGDCFYYAALKKVNDDQYL